MTSIEDALTTFATVVVASRVLGFVSDQLSAGLKSSKPPSAARTLDDYAQYVHSTLSQLPLDAEKKSRLLSDLKAFPSEDVKSWDPKKRLHFFYDLLSAASGDDKRSKATRSSIAVLSAWAHGNDLEE